MSNANNLKPWKPGQSGNPTGRPRGARSWGKIVNELLRNDSLPERLVKQGLIKTQGMGGNSSALELIAIAQIAKAIDGDVRAAEWLRQLQTNYELTNLEGNVPTALTELIENATDDELRTMAGLK